MSLQAKKEGILRIIGMILIIISFPITIWFDFHAIPNVLTYIFEILTIILWLFIVLCFKLEVEAIIGNMERIFMPLLIYSIIMITSGATVTVDLVQSVSFIFIVVSSVMCLLCWHFSLSIYKREKKAYIGTGITFIIFTLLFRMQVLLMLIPLILFIAGFSLIILAEYTMKKKGMLNYIE